MVLDTVLPEPVVIRFTASQVAPNWPALSHTVVDVAGEPIESLSTTSPPVTSQVLVEIKSEPSHADQSLA